jgi:hypothetical protein
VTDLAEQPATTEGAKAWRRVLVVSCTECGLVFARRDYRSRRKTNAMAAQRAVVRHTLDTGHKDVIAYVDHA